MEDRNINFVAPWMRVYPPEEEPDDVFQQNSGSKHMPPRNSRSIVYFYLMFTINLMKKFVLETNSCLHVSPSTIRRRRNELGLDPSSVDRFRAIWDDDLDEKIIAVLNYTPNAGETLVQGSLRGKGIRVPRWRVRERLNVIDPVGRAMRKRRTIRRRVYHVEHINQLWHVDTNHKLIARRFVFHGCIDGKSLLITYLNVDDNNRRDTSLTFFQNGVARYGFALESTG